MPWIGRSIAIGVVTGAMGIAAFILKKLAEPDCHDRPFVDGKGRRVNPRTMFPLWWENAYREK